MTARLLLIASGGARLSAVNAPSMTYHASFLSVSILLIAAIIRGDMSFPAIGSLPMPKK